MSDRMTPIPFAELLTQSLREFRAARTLYGVPAADAVPDTGMTLAGRPLSCPVGPAAGPHTQLAQNLIAGFAAGARVRRFSVIPAAFCYFASALNFSAMRTVSIASFA